LGLKGLALRQSLTGGHQQSPPVALVKKQEKGAA